MCGCWFVGNVVWISKGCTYMVCVRLLWLLEHIHGPCQNGLILACCCFFLEVLTWKMGFVAGFILWHIEGGKRHD